MSINNLCQNQEILQHLAICIAPYISGGGSGGSGATGATGPSGASITGATGPSGATGASITGPTGAGIDGVTGSLFIAVAATGGTAAVSLKVGLPSANGVTGFGMLVSDSAGGLLWNQDVLTSTPATNCAYTVTTGGGTIVGGTLQVATTVFSSLIILNITNKITFTTTGTAILYVLSTSTAPPIPATLLPLGVTPTGTGIAINNSSGYTGSAVMEYNGSGLSTITINFGFVGAVAVGNSITVYPPNNVIWDGLG